MAALIPVEEELADPLDTVSRGGMARCGPTQPCTMR